MLFRRSTSYERLAAPRSPCVDVLPDSVFLSRAEVNPLVYAVALARSWTVLSLENRDTELDRWVRRWVKSADLPANVSADGSVATVKLGEGRSRLPVVAPPEPIPDGCCVHLVAPMSSTASVSGSWKGCVQLGVGMKLTMERGSGFSPELKVVGDGSLVIERQVYLPGVEFKGSVDVTLSDSNPSLSNVSGHIGSLFLRNRSVISAVPEWGLHPKSLKLHQGAAEAELDHIGLFRMQSDSLPALRASTRLVPWFPTKRWRIDRARAKQMAIENSMGAHNATDTAMRRRADFWAVVASVMRGQSAGGREYAATRELAYEMRRNASSRAKPEYWLLSVAKIFGYGTRLGRPLAIWLVASAIAAISLIAIAGHGLADWSTLAVVMDVFTSPVAFVRPVATTDTVASLLQETDAWGRLVMWLMRLVGAAAIVALVLAVSIHARISGFAKSE